MPDLHDYELVKTDGAAVLEPTAKSRTGIVAAVIAVVIAGVVYYVYGRRPAAPASAQPVTKAVETAPPPAALGGEAERIAVPPLDESDNVVRDLVRKITSNPVAVAWLTTTGLVRNFTVVVANVVDGATPARHLRALKPAAPFRVVQRDGKAFIDPASYERYDRIAAAAESIDPAGAARVYATLKPRIQEAYGDLGMPPDTFDRALERAIISLLQTPVVQDPVRVETKGGVNYRYADDRLENLTAAQKQLLRTGPRNVRAVQAALRRLALALVIPGARLP